MISHVDNWLRKCVLPPLIQAIKLFWIRNLIYKLIPLSMFGLTQDFQYAQQCVAICYALPQITNRLQALVSQDIIGPACVILKEKENIFQWYKMHW